MDIVLVAGARPNFMKVAPLLHAMARRGGFTPFVIHTGQHYDADMSGVFFDDLGMALPDLNLGVGSGSHAVQTARVMTALEPVLAARRPSWVLVVGDVNSTLAAALVAAKLGLRVAHVEAGLRSGDRSMPEEINRLATDAIADLLLAPSDDARDNLYREGHPEQRVAMVGNVMVDTLARFLPRADAEEARRRFDLPEDYILATLHRPANVDDPGTLDVLLDGLATLAAARPVFFPAHPRLRQRLDARGTPAGLRLSAPLGYLDFLALERGARLVITDSGGVQEETTVLGVPCLTVRSSTERPITVHQGTNRLVRHPEQLVAEALVALERAPGTPMPRPAGWDGNASERILDCLQLPVAELRPAALRAG